MGKRYTVIPKDTFDTLQFDAGVLLKNFDIEAASTSINNPGFTDKDLICATTGGINASCVPTFSDFGEDVDNVPLNMMEFKHLDGYECKISTTGLGTSPELIKMALGAADIEGETKIVPRNSLNMDDFSDIWWVGDKANGGFVAINLKKALATTGFSLQTTKNGKGTVGLEITGHVSISAQNEVPMVFYSIDPDVSVEPDIVLNRSHIALEEGEKEAITAIVKPLGSTVVWSTSNDAVATVTGGTITAVGEGTATITGAITVSGVTYSDTCTVTVTALGA